MAFNCPLNWHIEWHTPNFQNSNHAQVLKLKSLNRFIPIFLWDFVSNYAIFTTRESKLSRDQN